MADSTFGEKFTTVDYKACYGVCTATPNADKSQTILVQASNGSWFLPGEGIEAGGDYFSALKRELTEELGSSAELGYYYEQADECFHSRHHDIYFYNPAYIYEVTHFKEIDVPLEDLNSLSWFPIDKAIEKSKRGSHKWGAEVWKRNHH